MKEMMNPGLALIETITTEDPHQRDRPLDELIAG
jgi:hypothetical protein